MKALKLSKPKLYSLEFDEYDRLNPPIQEFLVAHGEVFYSSIDKPEWCYVGYIPTPKTYLEWVVYHVIHGIWMKYPLWKVLLFALDKSNHKKLSVEIE